MTGRMPFAFCTVIAYLLKKSSVCSSCEFIKCPVWGSIASLFCAHLWLIIHLKALCSVLCFVPVSHHCFPEHVVRMFILAAAPLGSLSHAIPSTPIKTPAHWHELTQITLHTQMKPGTDTHIEPNSLHCAVTLARDSARFNSLLTLSLLWPQRT